MPKRKTAEEKRQEQEAKEAAKFLEREKAEYERRMKLAVETDSVVNADQSDSEADAEADEDEETSEDDTEENSDDEETENET